MARTKASIKKDPQFQALVAVLGSEEKALERFERIRPSKPAVDPAVKELLGAGFTEEEARVALADDAPKEEAPKARVVVFRLAGSVTETPSEDISLFGGGTTVALKDLIERMDRAAKDEAVKAVVILPAGGNHQGCEGSPVTTRM